MRYRRGEKFMKNFRFSGIPVGASLLAKAVCQAPIMLNDRALREQARSHRITLVVLRK
ncbi:hypothetical protein PMO01_05985 [Pseudomonas moraviensis R28-S]|uniref:Uncharacterized protein n=1 Tax=Pseudomonas moraviensis R28-S TaxID=1395516 RepID=V8RDP5_9PSED|nr:hypothetical protein PMO01_05985 [Pseudomonas moraviensis R28-S]